MSFTEIITAPWPWYISGPLLGLIVPLLLILGNKSLGISSFFCHTYAFTGIKKIELFNYNWKEYEWNILFVFGILISGIINANYFEVQFNQLSESATEYFHSKQIVINKVFPDDYFIKNIFSITSLLLVLGGFLVGFGSRYANGCTAGHAIMGLSLLNKGSLVAVLGFFVGGLLGTILIVDKIL